MHWFLIIRPVMTQKKTPENRFMRTGVVAQTALPSVTAKQAMVRQDSERTEVNRGGFAPIFPDICYHLTHYKPAAADIPV
ncbi:hypothetical protein, partial [Escherichia coli]|uniref:hypothetical protein n=1 Tax=Escherichia coli TaxID=562 RepID=UPI002ACBFABB